MKAVTILSLLLLASPVFGQLTKEDLRTILKEEVRPIIKEEITASEKRTREYIDLKIETVNARIDAVNTRIDGLEKSMDGRFDDIGTIMIALIGLIAAAIAIPQIIIAYRDRGQKEMERSQKEMQSQIDQLRKELEAMQNTPS